MDAMMIVRSVLVMAALGAAAGISLALARKYFQMAPDPLFDAVLAALPGAN